MLKFTFHTSEIESHIRGLNAFALAVPRWGADEIARQVVEFAKSGVAPDGRNWLKLSSAYARRKMTLVGNAKANKQLTGRWLASVRNRDNFVSAGDSFAGQTEGLERLRISFQVAPISAGNVERILLQKYLAI